MSVMGVNLRQLYQRPAAWFWYLIALSSSVGPLSLVLSQKGNQGRGFIMFFLIAPVAFAYVSGSLQVEILSKPFSYTLPKHKRIPRRFIFSVGVCVSALISSTFLLYPGLTPQGAILSFAAATLLSLTVYMIIASRSFVFSNDSWNGLPILLVVAACFSGLPRLLELAIVNQPFVVIVIGMLISGGLWVHIGNVDAGGRFCGQRYLGELNSMNPAKAVSHKEYLRAKKEEVKGAKGPATLETFYIGRMHAGNVSSIARCVWGSLYTSISAHRLNTFAGFSKQILIGLMFVLFYGYYGSTQQTRMVNILFFAPLMVGLRLRVPLSRTLFLPEDGSGFWRPWCMPRLHPSSLPALCSFWPRFQ